MVSLEKVKKPSQWSAARTKIESTVLDVMGKLSKERTELQVKTIDELQYSTYVRRRINYFVGPWERVTAWLFVPEGRDEVPGILCCHQMVPQGKDEPAGIEGEPPLALAQRYAEKGYVTLAPDCITAGGRVSSSRLPYDTKSFYKDNPKMSAMGKMLSDHIYALDALCDCKRVDSARIGVIGHDLGAQNALFLAAFDERIQACAASCGFTRFADDKEPERWVSDDGFVYFPKLKKAIKEGAFPFDWEHILALAAPSPTLLLTTLTDAHFPNPRSCEKAVKAAKRIYKLLGAAEAIDNFTHHGGHKMTMEALDVADEWLERWL